MELTLTWEEFGRYEKGFTDAKQQIIWCKDDTLHRPTRPEQVIPEMQPWKAGKEAQWYSQRTNRNIVYSSGVWQERADMWRSLGKRPPHKWAAWQWGEHCSQNSTQHRPGRPWLFSWRFSCKWISLQNLEWYSHRTREVGIYLNSVKMKI